MIRKLVYLSAGSLALFTISLGGDCTAEFDCGGCNNSWGMLKCVCKTVEKKVECLYCNSNNPCQHECMECCYKNLMTNQICCNKSTCDITTSCFTRCAAAAPPAVATAQSRGWYPVSGSTTTKVVDGVVVDSVNSTTDVDMSDVSLTVDAQGDLSGLEITLHNNGNAAVMAHGIIVDLFSRGTSTPVRLFQASDGWFDQGGLPAAASARYYMPITAKPKKPAPLERVVVGLDYVETKRGDVSGADIGRFQEQFRAGREGQKAVTAAVREIANDSADAMVLREAILAVGRRYPCAGARAAISTYVKSLDAGGSEALRQELTRHE